MHLKSIILEHNRWQLIIIDDAGALAIINHLIRALPFHLNRARGALDQMIEHNPRDLLELLYSAGASVT